MITSRSLSNHAFTEIVVQVSGRPFYGYYPREHQFFKIYFFNPWTIKRAADLLQHGAVLGQVFQPHYSHIPYTLQFMMDYNLQGMNLIHLRYAKFRQPSDIVKKSEVEPSPDEERLRQDPLHARKFDSTNIPVFLFCPEHVPRVSSCELEIDAVAADVLNTNSSLMSASVLGESRPSSQRNPIMNPGIEALWLDEIERRQRLGVDESLTPPSSPPRGSQSEIPTQSQTFWEERFRSALSSMQEQVHLEEECRKSMDADSTVFFEPGKKSPDVLFTAETPEPSELPAATKVEEHVASLTHSILELSLTNQVPSFERKEKLDAASKERFFNDTMIDVDCINESISAPSNVAGLTQGVGSNKEEDDLIGLLQELADERQVNIFQDEDDDQDEVDMREMSRVCWDVDPASQVSDTQLANQQENSQEIWDSQNSFWENLDVDNLLKH